MTTNISPLDGWSLVHAGVGVALGAMGVSRRLAIGGALAYEVVEYAHEYPSGSRLFGTKRPESISNAVTDVAVFWLGYVAGRRYLT